MRCFPALIVFFGLGVAGIGQAVEAVPAAASPKHPQALITTSKGAITIELFSDECPQTVASFTALAMGTKPFTDPATGKPATRPYYDGQTFHRVIKGFMIQGGCPKGDGSSGPGFTVPDEFNATSLGLDQERVMVGNDLNPQCAYQMREFTQMFLWPRMQELGITAQSTPQQRAEQLPKAIETIKGVTLRQFYEKIGYHYDDKLPASHKPVRGSVAMANAGPGTSGSQFFINLGDTPHLTGKHSVFGRVVAGMEVVDAIGEVKTGAHDRPLEPVTIVSIRLVGP